MLAVEPAQACSLSTTLPQSLPPAAVPPLALSELSSFDEPHAAANSASTSAITTVNDHLERFPIEPLLIVVEPFAVPA